MPPIAWFFVVLALSSGGSYWFGRTDGRSLEKGTQDREALVAKASRDAALQVTAQAIANMKVTHVTTRQLLERETREVPVYRDCRNTADGMLRINDALADAPSRPASSVVVPASGAAR
jgi:hypothetical protein